MTKRLNNFGNYFTLEMAKYLKARGFLILNSGWLRKIKFLRTKTKLPIYKLEKL